MINFSDRYYSQYLRWKEHQQKNKAWYLWQFSPEQFWNHSAIAYSWVDSRFLHKWVVLCKHKTICKQDALLELADNPCTDQLPQDLPQNCNCRSANICNRMLSLLSENNADQDAFQNLSWAASFQTCSRTIQDIRNNETNPNCSATFCLLRCVTLYYSHSNKPEKKKHMSTHFHYFKKKHTFS